MNKFKSHQLLVNSQRAPQSFLNNYDHQEFFHEMNLYISRFEMKTSRSESVMKRKMGEQFLLEIFLLTCLNETFDRFLKNSEKSTAFDSGERQDQTPKQPRRWQSLSESFTRSIRGSLLMSGQFKTKPFLWHCREMANVYKAVMLVMPMLNRLLKRYNWICLYRGIGPYPLSTKDPVKSINKASSSADSGSKSSLQIH